jgi:hypothetical protein
MMRISLLAFVLAVGACGGGNGNPATDGNNGSGSDAPLGPDGATADGWTPLISRTWTLAAGATNTYKCTRIKAANEMWVAGFRAASPAGTHHSVLTISTTNTQTGDYDCSAGSLDNQMLYAAGVGTDDLAFPPGVAMHIAAGTYINLNLHLFNATDQMMADTSGVLVKIVAQADVVNEADMMFSGKAPFTLTAGTGPQEVIGGCSAPTDWHIFTLWPHMHQIATHQKWTYTPSGGATVTLLDDDFVFTEQKNYPIPDTVIPSGARIETTCTYVNTTGHSVSFGDGSDKEMCFTGMYKYPAGGSLFQCAGF